MKIKWGKELYQGVDVNTDEDPMLFKAQIFALTGVQPERQKVMCKGVTLKDEDWGTVKLSNVSIHLFIRHSTFISTDPGPRVHGNSPTPVFF